MWQSAAVSIAMGECIVWQSAAVIEVSLLAISKDVAKNEQHSHCSLLVVMGCFVE